MGMMAMAYGIQDEDAWMWDGPSTDRSRGTKIVIPDDDWAVNPPIPETAEDAVREDEGERVSLAMSAWAEALGAPKAVVPAVELRLLVQEETPDQYEDSNARERERWVEWAKRAHPEWGANPKPPRRLAPSMRLARAGERGWATLVVVMDNATGYPVVVSRRDLEGRVPEDLDFYWPKGYETHFGPTTKIIRRKSVGEISLTGKWHNDGTTLRQKFPTLVDQRREWAKAHTDELDALMRKLV